MGPGWGKLFSVIGCLLACVGAGLPAVAGSSVPRSPRGEIAEQILREDRDRTTRVVGLSRARVSHPQQISAAIGAMVARLPTSYDCTAVCEFRGLLLQAEPGLAGGQLSAGYAVVVGETNGNGRFLSDVYLAYGIKGALLRTWGNADLEPEDQTLFGIEGDFTVIRVNFSLGVFRHIGSGDPHDRWLISGGVGWGF